MENSSQKKNLAQEIVKRIEKQAKDLPETKLMHVCGTHEDTISHHGLRDLLPENIKVISGPGCPVCVTTQKEIDEAIQISKQPEVIVTTFGDLIKVPGTNSSLRKEKTTGADIRIVYSPMDSLKIAGKNPDKKIVHLGIGFETTAPTTAFCLKKAPENFLVHCMHRTIPEAMQFLLEDAGSEIEIKGFIDPGHVSAIIGLRPYRPLSQKYMVPQVIAGFEAEDVLISIYMLLRMIAEGKGEVKNEYSRVVKEQGNPQALKAMDQVFEKEDVKWRGFPKIPGSGLKLNSEYEKHDAVKELSIEVKESKEPAGCRCGDILKGILEPWECPLFDKKCRPQEPVGPCMVSAEGACAIAYKHGRGKNA